jgi:NAD/NADP transhydrogenase beta subunit
MRSFLAIICAAITGFMLLGAVSVLVSPEVNLMAMLCGFLGGAALMGALLAFRRPTDAELLRQKEAKPITSMAESLLIAVIISVLIVGAMVVWVRYRSYFGF